jgi:hypothetical protein
MFQVLIVLQVAVDPFAEGNSVRKIENLLANFSNFLVSPALTVPQIALNELFRQLIPPKAYQQS